MRSWEDPVETTVVNVVGTLNLCTAAATLKPRPRVLLVSSSEVYGSVGSEDPDNRGPAVCAGHPLRGQQGSG